MATEARSVWMPSLVKVRGGRRETGDTVTLQLELPAGADPAHFAPGRFTMLHVLGVGEVPISLAAPGSADGLWQTVRDVGAVSGALTRLEPGASLGIRGPFGIGWPLESAVGRDLLLVAGGLGLAPIRSALLAALATRARFRRLVLLYGTRTPADRLYREELARWHADHGVEVHETVDRADANWRGHVGVVTTLLDDVLLDWSQTVAFVCGPEVMMRFVAARLVHLGVAPDAIFLSLERNMHCGIGLCGRCQLGPLLVCRDGPVVPFARVADLLTVQEL